MNSTWLITSELANQRARKVLFTCVVYTNYYYFLSFFPWAADSEDAAPRVEGTDIDPAELLEVSAEHENQGSSAGQPINGPVNDITKQQLIVQFLKVWEFADTSSDEKRKIRPLNESLDLLRAFYWARKHESLNVEPVSVSTTLVNLDFMFFCAFPTQFVNMYGFSTKCEVKMAGYWPSSFFAS